MVAIDFSIFRVFLSDLPAVTSDWLKQCLELECKAPIKSYLVCNSKSDDVESDDVGNADERVIKGMMMLSETFR